MNDVGVHTNAASCPLCGVTSFQRVMPATGAPGNEVRCKCELVFIHPRPSQNELIRAYATTLIEDSGTEEIGVDGKVVVPGWKARETALSLRLLGEGLGSGRVLDVGCLWGIFLSAARDAGYEVEGLEPWDRAASYCRDVEGLPVTTGGLDGVNLDAAAYDGVALLDVIEHFQNPFDELRRVNRILRPGGAIIVGTPNVRSLRTYVSKIKRKVRRQDTTVLTPPFHLYGFTPVTLRAALEQTGFALVRLRFLPEVIGVGRNGFGVSVRRGLGAVLSRVGAPLRMGDRLLALAVKVDA